MVLLTIIYLSNLSIIHMAAGILPEQAGNPDA
jgi:hypothetical protein